jgi:hypothetical protein
MGKALRRGDMRQTGEYYMISGKHLTGSFVTGLAALVTIVDPGPNNFGDSSMSANRALGGDFDRIGSDMFKAIKSETNDEKAAGKKNWTVGSG